MVKEMAKATSWKEEYLLLPGAWPLHKLAKLRDWMVTFTQLATNALGSRLIFYQVTENIINTPKGKGQTHIIKEKLAAQAHIVITLSVGGKGNNTRAIKENNGGSLPTCQYSTGRSSDTPKQRQS